MDQVCESGNEILEENAEELLENGEDAAGLETGEDVMRNGEDTEEGDRGGDDGLYAAEMTVLGLGGAVAGVAAYQGHTALVAFSSDTRGYSEHNMRVAYVKLKISVCFQVIYLLPFFFNSMLTCALLVAQQRCHFRCYIGLALSYKPLSHAMLCALFGAVLVLCVLCVPLSFKLFSHVLAADGL